MNKAFVKEVEGSGGRCPRCGSLGLAVPAETLASFIRDEKRSNLAETGYFCEFPRCEAIYFDDFERFVTAADVVRPVWPKDSDAPLCGCFGLTADDVAADVREGGVARVKAAVARAKSSEARCLTMSPTGRNCAADIQRYYFKLRPPPGV